MKKIKIGYAITILASLATIIGVFGDLLYKRHPETSQTINNSPGSINTQNQAGGINTVVNNLNQITKTNPGLRKVMPLETQKPIELLPDGIYGYTYNFIIVRVVDTKEIGKLELLVSSVSDSEKQRFFEVRKYSRQEIYAIGYISDEIFSRIGNASELEANSIVFLPKKYGDFKNFVAIPLANIISLSYRDIQFDEQNRISVLDIKTNKIDLKPEEY